MNPEDIAKVAPSASGSLVGQAPTQASEFRQVLAYAVIVFLAHYFRIRFNHWFGLTNPLAFALALFLASTLSYFIDRPRKLLGFAPKRPFLTFSLITAALAIVSYVVGRIYHF